MSERPLPVFDLSGTAHEVAQRWQRWKRSFNYYVEGEGISRASKLRSKMLHLAGMPVQDIFATLTEPVVPRGQAALDDYEKAVKMLDDHFAYKPNTAFERHLFRKMSQREGETVAQFVHRLREQAALCAFGERTVSEHLRDQVVEQVRDERLRRKLLEKEDLTLQIALDTARQFETTEASARGMRLAPEKQVLSIQAKDKRRNQSSRPQKREECANCGSWNHSAGDDDCPARGITCHGCKKKGHFRHKCRNKRQWRGSAGKNARSVKNVRGGSDVDDDSEDDEFGLAIGKIHEGNAAAEQPIVVDVTIADVPVQMEVDTGAFVTIMSQKQYTRLFAHIPLRKSQHLLRGYGGHRIEVAGEFTAHVAHNGQEAELPIVVTRTERDALPLLGRNWLAVMRLDWKSLFPRATAIHQVEVEQVANPAHWKERYPDVFREELGTVRGVNANFISSQTWYRSFVNRVQYHLRYAQPWSVNWNEWRRKAFWSPSSFPSGLRHSFVCPKLMEQFGSAEITRSR